MWSVLALSSFGLANAAAGTAQVLCQKLLATPCNDAGIKQFPNTYSMNQTDCETYLGGMGWGPGTDADTTGNTFGCRIYYANMATANNKAPCRYAGITGGGVCGADPLDNACKSIVGLSCGGVANSAYPDVATCKTGLASLAAIWGSLQGPASANDDSLECRVYHALVGYNNGNRSDTTYDSHCNHTLVPNGGAGWCGTAPAPVADHYCTIHSTTCVSPWQQYANNGDCLASFAAFNSTGPVAATNLNNQGCRQYHLQAAAIGVAPGLVHCTHGGPTGAGQCGTPYEAWISISNSTACAATRYVAMGVAAAVGGFDTADLTSIIPVGNATYNSTSSTSGDTVQCRVYHGTVAAGGGTTHCTHPSVASPACFDGQVPALGTVCKMILAGCGTTASGFADANACVMALANLTDGAPTDNNGMPNTDTKACRGYNAALALAAKHMSLPVTGACLNVKAVAGPNCSAANMTSPTAASPTAAKSDASMLVISGSLALPLLFL